MQDHCSWRAANLPTLARVLVAVALASSPVAATTFAPQLSLDELCRRGDRVFLGTVVSASDDTVRAGGGTIPTVTYRIKVDEAFKGEFQDIKGTRVVDVRMLRQTGFQAAGKDHVRIVGLPRLEVGASYVLMMSRPSRIGMSSPIGLTQGIFRISSGATGERVEASPGFRTPSSLTYRDFAQRLRLAVERGRRAR